MHQRLLAAEAVIFTSCVLGCGEPPSLSSPYDGPPLSSPAVVLLSNLQVSGLGRIDTAGNMIEAPDIALGSDPMLARSGEKLFAIVRDQNVIYEVDPSTLALSNKFASYEDAEIATPRMVCNRPVKGINPQDVAVDSWGRRWITRYDIPTLAVVASDGSFAGTVDLSAYADADGLPEVAGMHIVGDRAYVAIERLDRCSATGEWMPTGPGAIVEIDAANLTVLKSIELGGANPFGRLAPVPWDPSGNTVVVALANRFLHIDDMGDAAAIIDLSSGKVQGFGRETDLDGSVAEVALAAPDEAYVIVTNPKDPTTNATSVHRLDPQTGQVQSKLVDSRTGSNAGGGYCHRGLAVVGEHVLVGSKEPCEVGILVFDRQSNQRLGLIPPTKLPPIAIQVVP